jgi:hypothetical protein
MVALIGAIQDSDSYVRGSAADALLAILAGISEEPAIPGAPD